MERIDIERLRQLPIESVAERLGLQVSRHKALCPFHEDRHPSLSFHVGRNTYRCFVCGAHGGPIDLAMKLLRETPISFRRGVGGEASFMEACQWLADEHNIITEKYAPAVKQMKQYPPDVEYLSLLVSHPMLNEQARRFLFDERKLNPKVVEWCGISSINADTPCWRYGKPFYDGPSLLIPYKDVQGRVVNVQSRYLGSDTSKPRFRFPSNSSVNIFNLPILRYLKPGEPLYISEGITDCLALLSSGHKAIAIPSATLLKPQELEILKSYLSPSPLGEGWGEAPLHIFPDNDPAGERLYRQLVSFATDIGVCLVRHDLPLGCKDFGEYWVAKNTKSTNQ